MIRRVTAGLILAAAAATIAPNMAFAEHCDDTMVVFSGVAGAPKVNSNAVLCLAAGEDAGDTRIINPGSNEITVRFTQDFGAGTPEIQATINGLGFESQTITLKRGPGPVDGFVYDSARLPLDPTAVGCITAELTEDWGGADNGATAFHTVGTSC